MGVLGDIQYRAALVWKVLNGNTTTTRKFLRQVGTGAASAAPAWDTLQAADLPSTAVTPGSYTATNLTVDQQGRITAAASGSSGSGTVTNTGALTNHALIKGNGGVDVSALGSLGTTTTVLHGNAAGDPTFGAVVEADITLANNTTNNVTTSAHGFAPILPNDATKFLNGVGAYAVPAGSGTVTTTGSPASGNLTKFSGATSIVNGDLSGDVTTSGTLATTIANDAVTTAKILNANVTLAKIANAAASSKLVGSGASGSGAAYSEISLGTGLTMTGTTLSASGGGGGWTQIQQIITSGSATSIDFTSIPGSYTNLRIVIKGRLTGAVGEIALYCKMNNDNTSTNYSDGEYLVAVTGLSPLQGNPPPVTNFGVFAGTLVGTSASADAAGQVAIEIPGYADTIFRKTFSTDAFVYGRPAQIAGKWQVGGMWKSTAAITRLTLAPASDSFLNGTIGTLYGY